MESSKENIPEIFAQSQKFLILKDTFSKGLRSTQGWGRFVDPFYSLAITEPKMRNQRLSGTSEREVVSSLLFSRSNRSIGLTPARWMISPHSNALGMT